MEPINETKSWLFERANKKDQPLANIIKKKDPNEIRNEEVITITNQKDYKYWGGGGTLCITP